MGLFDSMYFRFLPDEYQQGGILDRGEYQTKDLLCVMDSYEVDEEGNVYLQKYQNGKCTLEPIRELSGAFNAGSSAYDSDGNATFNVDLQGIIYKGKLLILLHGNKVLFVHPELIQSINIYIENHAANKTKRHE